LVGRVTNERLEPETNGIGVRLRTGGGSSLAQQTFVDVECLLHPYKYAISIWLGQPSAVDPAVRQIVCSRNDRSTEDRKKAIRESAEQKIKKLKGEVKK
jgi:hypothetical protein